MKKQLLVSVDRGETRVALLEATGSPGAATKAPARGRKDPAAGYRVAELYFERRGARSIVGNIYKGKVDNVLAGLEAAFVDIGLEKNGFLHVDEIVVPGVDVGRRGRGGKEGGSKITELIKPGQEIVVQVVKDPLKSKGARLSMELTIAGRYMVYAPTGEGVGVSRRLDDKERERLRREAKGLDLRGGGAIIRTAAHGAGGEDFERELQYLFKLRDVLDKRVAETAAPGLVFQEADLSVRVVRDIFSEHFERAIVDDPKQHQRLVSFFTRTAPELVDRVELYEEKSALFAAYGVEKVIDGLMTRRVDLPSGGYLIIDYAEALTVIDVNSGSFIGRGKGARLEDTITTTNLEAAEEVVNQLRLRDIGGIIVIDFIDMARARNREAVLKTLRKTLDEDRTKTFTAEISKLGLVEMTRQNVTEGVREIISRACPTCDGDGVIKSEETIAIEFERRLRTLTKKAPKKHEAFLVQMNPRVSAVFTGNAKRVLHALEEETGRRFHFTGSEGLPLDHFDIVMEGSKDEVMERAVPFREGDEVLVHIVEPHMYDVDDAVAKIDGYIISVSGGGRFVGSKKLVRVEHAGRTSATAVLLGEDAIAPEPVEPAPPKPSRPPRTRTRAARPAARAPEATEPEVEPAQAAAEKPAEKPAEKLAEASAGGETGDATPPSADGQSPDEPAAEDGADATPRRRGRRGGRRRSRSAAESGAAEPSPSET
jgi:ribonuclease G